MADAFIAEGRAIARRVQAGTSNKADALLKLSRAFETSRTIENLAACVTCVADRPDTIDFDHAALMAVNYALFTKCAHFPRAEFNAFRQRLLAPAYVKVLERLHKAFRAHLAPRPVEPDEAVERILFITPQILRLDHAPTLRACEISRQMMKRSKSVLIVNPNSWPLYPASTFYPPWAANTLPHQGMIKVEYEDVGLPVFSIPAPRDIVGRLAKTVSVAASFRPHAILNQGELNLAGELLSYAYPSVFLPTTSCEPITRAHVIVDNADNYPELAIDHAGLYGFTPQVAGIRLDLSVLPEKTRPQTRAEHGLPQDAFVIAVVGTRLAVELTDGFCDMLADVLDAAPQAHLAFVGSEPSLSAALKAKAGEGRVSELGHNPDLSSFFALVDCYVNPPRIGAGRTAYLAALERVPVLTTPEGDAAMAIGRHNAVADVAAVKAGVLALATDAEARAQAKQTAERVRTEILARASGESFDRLLGAVGDARRRFAATAEPGTLAATG